MPKLFTLIAMFLLVVAIGLQVAGADCSDYDPPQFSESADGLHVAIPWGSPACSSDAVEPSEIAIMWGYYTNGVSRTAALGVRGPGVTDHPGRAGAPTCATFVRADDRAELGAGDRSPPAT